MTETTLARIRCERFTDTQLQAEIARIKGAMTRPDTAPKQRRRYQQRLAIYQEEADNRKLVLAFAAAAAAPLTTTIIWIDPAKELPDDEETVLVVLADGELWLGFHTEDDWAQVSAELFDQPVRLWAHIPKVDLPPLPA